MWCGQQTVLKFLIRFTGEGQTGSVMLPYLNNAGEMVSFQVHLKSRISITGVEANYAWKTENQNDAFFQITVSTCFWLYLNPVWLIKYCFTFNKSSIVKWYQSIPKHVTWFLASCLPVVPHCVRISLGFFCSVLLCKFWRYTCNFILEISR